MNNTKFTILISIIFISTLIADIASPTPFKSTQPNGLELFIQNRGNHLQGWHEYNSWTILKDQDGWWMYALGNDGQDLIPSNLRVGIDHPDQGSSLMMIRVLSILKRLSTKLNGWISNVQHLFFA